MHVLSPRASEITWVLLFYFLPLLDNGHIRFVLRENIVGCLELNGGKDNPNPNPNLTLTLAPSAPLS